MVNIEYLVYVGGGILHFNSTTFRPFVSPLLNFLILSKSPRSLESSLSLLYLFSLFFSASSEKLFVHLLTGKKSAPMAPSTRKNSMFDRMSTWFRNAVGDKGSKKCA